MAKMMTYQEANVILESSLTPNGRCICKKTAIDNHAVASNLTAYVDNRLVPASMVVLITYSIQFKDWDGTVLSTQTVRYGHTPTLPSNPSRTGYTFTGWSNNPSTAPSGDTVYTAQYTINSYTVTFKDWDNTTLKTQSVNYGSNATPPSNPSRTGYTFTGWSPSNMTITSDTTFTAQYSINSYTIRFLDYNGSVLNTQSVNYGSTPTPPNNPTRTGYTFTGWSPSVSAIYSNQDYTAQYTANSYTITWKFGNGQSDQVDTYSYGQALQVPANPTRSGYTFSGWSPQPTQGSAVTASTTYTAQWSSVTYTVTWKYKYPDNNQEYTHDTQTYPISGSYSLVFPSTPSVSSGYTFPGWSASGAVAGSTVSASTTYTVTCTADTPSNTIRIYWDYTDPADQQIHNYSYRDYDYNDAIGYGHIPSTSPTTSASGYTFNSSAWTNSVGTRVTTSTHYTAWFDTNNPNPSSINITFTDNVGYNQDVVISRNLTNGSYTLQSGDFPQWTSSMTYNRYPYTAHSPFWNYSAGDTLTSNTTITGTYDAVVNNSRFYYYYEASQFGGQVLYSGNVENGQDPETTLGANAWANNHNHGGYTFAGWSGPTETSHPGSSGQSPWTSYDYVATYERTETEKTVSFYLEYRDVNTPAQAISGSISAHAGGWGASGSLTPGNGCTFSCSNSADWAYDVYGSGEINGEPITFSDMPWNSSMTFYVEDYVTISGGGGGTGGDDPNEHNTDTPNEPGGNTGGTTDDGGGGSNLEGGEQQGSGGAGQGNSGNQGGQETHEEDPNVNPGSNEGGDTGGGGNNEGGTTGGNTGTDTEDHDQEELEP